MINIAIIESYSDNSRKVKWNKIVSNFSDCFSFEQVSENIEQYINAIAAKQLFVVFAHLGDTEDFNEALFANCKSSNVVLVQYTGGVKDYQISDNTIENIPFVMLMENIDAFLSEHKTSDSISVDGLGILVNIDPNLEQLLKPFENTLPLDESWKGTKLQTAKDKLLIEVNKKIKR